jgi:hypothetical protein
VRHVHREHDGLPVVGVLQPGPRDEIVARRGVDRGAQLSLIEVSYSVMHTIQVTPVLMRIPRMSANQPCRIPKRMSLSSMISWKISPSPVP